MAFAFCSIAAAQLALPDVTGMPYASCFMLVGLLQGREFCATADVIWSVGDVCVSLNPITFSTLSSSWQAGRQTQAGQITCAL